MMLPGFEAATSSTWQSGEGLRQRTSGQEKNGDSRSRPIAPTDDWCLTAHDCEFEQNHVRRAPTFARSSRLTGASTVLLFGDHLDAFDIAEVACVVRTAHATGVADLNRAERRAHHNGAERSGGSLADLSQTTRE